MASTSELNHGSVSVYMQDCVTLYIYSFNLADNEFLHYRSRAIGSILNISKANLRLTIAIIAIMVYVSMKNRHL